MRLSADDRASRILRKLLQAKAIRCQSGVNEIAAERLIGDGSANPRRMSWPDLDITQEHSPILGTVRISGAFLAEKVEAVDNKLNVTGGVIFTFHCR